MMVTCGSLGVSTEMSSEQDRLDNIMSLLESSISSCVKMSTQLDQMQLILSSKPPSIASSVDAEVITNEEVVVGTSEDSHISPASSTSSVCPASSLGTVAKSTPVFGSLTVAPGVRPYPLAAMFFVANQLLGNGIVPSYEEDTGGTPIQVVYHENLSPYPVNMAESPSPSATMMLATSNAEVMEAMSDDIPQEFYGSSGWPPPTQRDAPFCGSLLVYARPAVETLTNFDYVPTYNWQVPSYHLVSWTVQVFGSNYCQVLDVLFWFTVRYSIIVLGGAMLTAPTLPHGTLFYISVWDMSSAAFDTLRVYIAARTAVNVPGGTATEHPLYTVLDVLRPTFFLAAIAQIIQTATPYLQLILPWYFNPCGLVSMGTEPALVDSLWFISGLFTWLRLLQFCSRSFELSVSKVGVAVLLRLVPQRRAILQLAVGKSLSVLAAVSSSIRNILSYSVVIPCTYPFGSSHNIRDKGGTKALSPTTYVVICTGSVPRHGGSRLQSTTVTVFVTALSLVPMSSNDGVALGLLNNSFLIKTRFSAHVTLHIACYSHFLLLYILSSGAKPYTILLGVICWYLVAQHNHRFTSEAVYGVQNTVESIIGFNPGGISDVIQILLLDWAYFLASRVPKQYMSAIVSGASGVVLVPLWLVTLRRQFYAEQTRAFLAEMLGTQVNTSVYTYYPRCSGAVSSLSSLSTYCIGYIVCEQVSIQKHCVARDDSADGEIPLLMASLEGKERTIVYLLTMGGNPDVRDEEGLTPLHHAIVHGLSELVLLLLSHGVDANANSSMGTPLESAAKGMPEIAKQLLGHHANPNLSSSRAYTPLLHAVPADSLQCVELLLEAGAYPDKAGAAGVTPFLLAVGTGQTDIVRGLLNYGVNPDVTGERDLKTKEVFAEAKSKGDHAFREKDYSMAVIDYSMAIAAEPSCAVLLFNWSLCYACLKCGEEV